MNSLSLSLLAGVALMAATTAVIAAPPAPILQDGVEVIIMPSMSAGAGPDSVVDVQLDVEARNDDAAHKLGFRSMHGFTSIDCRSGANRFTKAEAFDQAGLSGQGVDRPVSGDWVTPTPASSMFAVSQRVCANIAQAGPSGAAPTVTAAGDGAALASPPKPPHGAHAARVAALPVVSTPGEAAAPVGPPTPAPVRVAARLPARDAALPAAIANPSAKPGPWVAQVAASDSEKAAEQVLGRLRTMIAAPLGTSVEPAVVNNAHLFRASVTGFATSGEAKAFCARAASVSKTCWAHLKSGGGH